MTAPASSAASRDRGPALSRGRRWAATGALAASLLVVAMDMTVLNIALPALTAELRPTSVQLLWIVDVYSLVLAGLLVPCAALADRWGRRRTLLLGYGLFAGASLLVPAADAAPGVIAVRALLGVGGAMILPTTLSMIRVLFTDPAERATALGVWAAVSGLGAAAGPLVGGFLLQHFPWEAAFLVNVPLILVALVAGLALLPESRVAEPGRWDARAAVLALAGMVLLVWAVKRFGEGNGPTAPEAWAALAGAGVALTWFARRCLGRADPLLELRLFGRRPFTAGIVAALGTTFSMVGAMLLLAQWLQLADGASPMAAGVRLLPVATAGVAASLLAPPLARLLGARTVLAAGPAVTGTGLLVLALTPGPLALPAVLTALTLIGAGTGSLAVGSALIMSSAPEEQAGSAGALEETSYELGAALGVAVLGTVAGQVYRARLADTPALHDAPPGLAAQAAESLGGAVGVADRLDLPRLAEQAATAFTEALRTAGLVGAVLMFAVAATVFALAPGRRSASD
ncbi:MFS transporter [Streptomyces albidoflavus]|uniref:MFS transporter n=1 Tax=Streptomyces albidoflavus TaxID=1886 RepID=UPI00344F5C24